MSSVNAIGDVTAHVEANRSQGVKVCIAMNVN
jgi:hypothetical protein